MPAILMQTIDRVWIQKRIYIVRTQKVMLSSDLALLYGVEPRALIQAVKRNIERFPEDFMFQLTAEEAGNLKSQIVISSWGGIRSMPHAFTEQGIAMLSSVLRSSVAIQINIAVIREFVALRRFLISHQELSIRINRLEEKYDKHFKAVFDAIRSFVASPEKPKKRIGIAQEKPKLGCDLRNPSSQREKIL